MTNPHGSWIWYELMTPDPAASKTFYDAVMGWTVDVEPMMSGEPEYRLIQTHDGQAGGVLTLSPDMLSNGVSAGWIGYVGVDDVDASVAALTGKGGAVHLPAMDVPDVGRMAMVSDPQGGHFYVMRGASPEASNAYQRWNTAGHVSWNELQTSDDAAALGFYGDLFGWRKAGGMPMPWGEYSFLQTAADADAFGALMPRQEAAHPVTWNFYFRVPDAAAAHAKVSEMGGTTLSEPMEVPGGDKVFQAKDPHSAVFGIVAPQ